MRYDKISFIFVISKVDLVGIESNNASMTNLNLGTLDPQNPLKPHSDRKVSNWNLDGGHLSYRLAQIRKLGPAVGYANISGSICSYCLYI